MFPREQRELPWARPVQVGARTLHLAGMGVVLGGVAFGHGAEQLSGWIVLTIASGVALFAVDLARSGTVLYQLSGLAVFLKLVLLGIAQLVPAQRFALYLAATAVASIGSHMPGRWRHYSIVDRRVI